jgi:hypothetical protein
LTYSTEQRYLGRHRPGCPPDTFGELVIRGEQIDPYGLQVKREQVSQFSLGHRPGHAGAGLAIGRSIAAPSNSITAGQVAASMLGAGAYFVITTTLVASVMISTGTPWREYASGIRSLVTFTGAGALLGLALATAIQDQLWPLTALVIPGLICARRLISTPHHRAA